MRRSGEVMCGRLMRIVGIGRVVEVLPFVFMSLDILDPKSGNRELVFLRSARLDLWNYYDEPISDYDPRLEVSKYIFLEAVGLLAQGLTVQQDLTPGLIASSDSVAFSALIASAIHANQFDKSGLPFIEHARRVFLNSQQSLQALELSEEERLLGYQAAWLHDVLEDSKDSFYRPINVQDLENWGLGQRVAFLVNLLTRSTEQSADNDYYLGVLSDKTARSLKLADIADNLSKWRTELLDEADREKVEGKYRHALEELEFDPSAEGWFQPRVDSHKDDIWPVFALPESSEALRMRQTSPHDKSWIFFHDDSWWHDAEKVDEGARRIIEGRLWTGREKGTSSRAALLPYPLDAWYMALFVLYSKGQDGVEKQSREMAESLADFLDSVRRDELDSSNHLGLVSRDVNYLQLKLRYPAALAGLFKFDPMVAHDSGVSWGELSPSVDLLPREQMLDMAVLAFNSTWSFKLSDSYKFWLSQVFGWRSSD